MKLKNNEKRMIKNNLISENEIILYSGIYLTRLSFILKNRNKTIYYNLVFTVGSFSNVSVHQYERMVVMIIQFKLSCN